MDPYDDEELSVSALSDAILEIARDIRNGLVLYDGGAGEQQANAVWAWRFSFVTHWGDHAVSALRALQHAIYRESGGPRWRREVDGMRGT